MKIFKKNHGYKLIIFLALTVLVFTLSACGSSSAPKDSYIMEDSANSIDSGAIPSVAPRPEAVESIGFTSQVKNDAYQAEQKIIYNGTINIEVNEINEATDAIENAVKTAGGYLLNSNKSENDQRYYARYEYKVPVDGLYPLIDQINDMSIGKITDQYINGNDVTEEYLDINSRLKAKRIYEERLLDLFSQAKVTEDLLKISNDLSIVQEEIEQLEGRQKYLSYHADNSTLIIEMQQYKNKVAPTATSWEKSLDGFKQSIEFIKDLFIAAFVWIVSSLPILILIFIIVIALWFFVRKKIRPKKNNITYSNYSNIDSDNTDNNDKKR